MSEIPNDVTHKKAMTMTASITETLTLPERARVEREKMNAANAKRDADARRDRIKAARRHLVWAFKRELQVEIAEDDPRIEVDGDGSDDTNTYARITIDGILFAAGQRYRYERYETWIDVVRPCEECGELARNALSYGGLAALADLLDAPAMHVHGCPCDLEAVEEVRAAAEAPAPATIEQRLVALIREVVQEELANQ